MGQSQISTSLVPNTQRIQPTPGSSGRRNRRGAISIYCEISLSIYTFKISPGMTVQDLKSLIPLNNFDLYLNSDPLPNDLILQQLDFDHNTLIRIVQSHPRSYKSSSTTDSSQEPEVVKTFGPKQKLEGRIEQPDNDSVLSCEGAQDTEIGRFLKAFSVPDAKLETRKEKRTKKVVEFL